MKFEKYIKLAKFHLGIVLRGLARTLHGAFITGLIAFAVYGFVLIKGESGYAAVFDFVASVATLVVALANAYALGSKRRSCKK